MRGLLRLICMAFCAGCALPGDLAFSTGFVDFGPALPGIERTQRVELINRSRAPLRLVKTESSNPYFSLSLSLPMTLDPLEIRPLTLRHVPPEGATEPEMS